MKLRPIAFVLPQFHPIPENDEWWGKGFTEWTNVTKAEPQYKGHYQPHLPADLGFYDLRLPQARKAQADLALEYGIQGFCYYHYWFNGKRLLEQPIDGMLDQKDLDMPFMFCWANENWTRRWDGKDEEILIKQDYSLEDDANHIRWLCENVFNDSRYIRVNGSPVFMIYRPELFPDINETAKIWREIAQQEYGFKNLYLCFTESFGQKMNPAKINFDAAVEFAPHQILSKRIKKSNFINFLEKTKIKPKGKLSFRDFKAGVDVCIKRKQPSYKLYRCVTPSWDNTARRGENAIIALGSNPQIYYNWLKETVNKFEPFSENENFVFINAMNEWAEGNHLEPCSKYGTEFLEMTKKALDRN